MECPSCESKEVRVHPKLRAFYPAAPVLILGPVFAMLHQLCEAQVCRCGACGREFRKRSVIARISYVLLVIVVVGMSFSFLGAIVRIVAWISGAAAR